MLNENMVVFTFYDWKQKPDEFHFDSKLIKKCEYNQTPLK